jgi:molybdopterin-binding protein
MKVNQGAVNLEVVVWLPNGFEIVSIISKPLAKNLGLKKGKEVYTIIKATNVIMAMIAVAVEQEGIGLVTPSIY